MPVKTHLQLGLFVYSTMFVEFYNNNNIVGNEWIKDRKSEKDLQTRDFVTEGRTKQRNPYKSKRNCTF